MTQKRWVIQEILHVAKGFLRDKGIESPRLCAEVLLSYQLRKSRVKLYLAFDKPLSNREVAGYRSLIKRRLAGEPLQYITGHQEFWSLDFLVSPAVLIPRPETELLVEEALRIREENLLPENHQPILLDLGTGSGAIAISLAREIQNATVWASDISFEALAVARANARNHSLDQGIRFCQGDLWQPFSRTACPFDMIISNPPYIVADALKTLPNEVRSHEPRVALDGREHGMHFIERIIAEAADYLKPGGWILIEMDPDQTEKALCLIDNTQCFSHGERMMDYQKHYRAVKAQRKHG